MHTHLRPPAAGPQRIQRWRRLRLWAPALVFTLALTACGVAGESADPTTARSHDKPELSSAPTATGLGSSTTQPAADLQAQTATVGTGNETNQSTTSSTSTPAPEADDVVAEEAIDLSSTAANGGSDELLDVVEPIDDAPAANETVSIREEKRINEAGELNLLDESASLACGDVEIALTALDDGATTVARSHLLSAAERAAASGYASIAARGDDLNLAAEAIADGELSAEALFNFLSTCTQGGHEL